ncbi:MAG: OmpA family protein [Gammaproteobacteria bacterium]
MTSKTRSVVLTFGCISLFTSAIALAHESGSPTSGAYTGDGSGHLITDGSGNCVRVGTWNKDGKQAECDADMVKAAEPAPEPAPVAEPADAPAPAPVPVPQSITKAVSLGSGALFGVNSSSLSAGGKAQLDQLAGDLKSLNTIENVQIVGHTDSTGAASYNQSLSEKRANAVRDYLASQGIDSASMTTAGMGETQPVASNTSRDGRAQNRRVDISIKGTKSE